jgi:hypothetical protein
VTIHDVEMQPVGTGTLRAFGPVTEAGVIRGKQRWGNDYIHNFSLNLFSQQLAPSAADDHETASVNHQSSNRPASQTTLRLRKTRCASPGALVANKADAPDESGRHWDLRATCGQTLFHS